MIESFRHKGLKELFEKGRSAKVDPSLRQRCMDILDTLEAAQSLKDLNLPGYNLHELHEEPLRYSIHVNGPWAITFEWNAPKAFRVDLEQYHVSCFSGATSIEDRPTLVFFMMLGTIGYYGIFRRAG